MKKYLQSIRDWLKETRETIRFAINLDMRVLDDPAWLLGTKPRLQTKRMVEEAKKRAGISHTD